MGQVAKSSLTELSLQMPVWEMGQDQTQFLVAFIEYFKVGGWKSGHVWLPCWGGGGEDVTVVMGNGCLSLHWLWSGFWGT